MAKSVNKAQLLGYVGKAPEIRSTGGDTLAATFSLATSERQEDREFPAELRDGAWAGLLLSISR
jgi:single-stranded DNA-binding protein